MFDTDYIEKLGRYHQYQECEYDSGQGVMSYTRPSYDGNRELIRVWWRTQTVGTYLKHPRQGKTQLFRREVNGDMLEDIFRNPRQHTGQGYHYRSQAPPQRRAQQERTIPCPGCGRLFASAVGTVSHFESGSCPTCPNVHAARRTAYNFVAQHDPSGNFVSNGTLRIGYHDTNGNWDPEGPNYHCNSCGRQFRQLNSLMQHQQARAQCMPSNGPQMMPPMLTYQPPARSPSPPRYYHSPPRYYQSDSDSDSY